MQIGDKVSVEFVGKIVSMRENLDGSVCVNLEIGPKLFDVGPIPIGACTPIRKAEEIPLVGGDGSC